MLLDLSNRAKFKVTGKDRVRFLNGQLTNDIDALHSGSAIYACALTAKGKLCADLFVAATEESHYLDAESLLRESLPARLEKYIIADDVTLEDVTDEFGLLHLTGSKFRSESHYLDAESLLRESLPARLEKYIIADDVTLEDVTDEFGLLHLTGSKFPVSSESIEVFQIESARFGPSGVDLWFPASQTALIKEILKNEPIDAEAQENLRIEQGIARWGSELSENVIPNEAALDKRAISYTKGCYLGQEVISRIKSLGHVNRQLRGLLPVGEIALEARDKLVGTAEASREVGLITSVGRSRSLGRAIALGYIRRGFDAPGSTLQVRRNDTLIGLVEVCSLPFISA